MSINKINYKGIDFNISPEEIITNENGTAIKFPTGIMICTKTITFTNVTFQYVQGNLNFCTTLQFGSTPETFTEVYYGNVNVKTGWALCPGLRNTSLDNFGNTQLFRGDSTTQESLTLELIMIGRWK